MEISVTEQLRDAFASFAETLAPIVEQLQITNSSDARQIDDARIKLVSAARELDTFALEKLFAGSSDLAKLKLLADEINAKADSIAGAEQNVARIVGIAAGAVSIVSAVGSGNVGDVITAVKNVTSILD